ncbi:MAG: hypothetical protein JWM61_2970 [Micrococcaceae bacterium]|nr:hypothetical protein [Micrococcaceae bacterium]
MWREAHRVAQIVWIVCQDETPHNAVRGVYETEAEARSLADDIQDRFPQRRDSLQLGSRNTLRPGHSLLNLKRLSPVI